MSPRLRIPGTFQSVKGSRFACYKSKPASSDCIGVTNLTNVRQTYQIVIQCSLTIVLDCPNPGHHDSLGDFGVKEYLSKEEAAAFVIEIRKAKKETLQACNYDAVVAGLMNLTVDM